MNAAAPPTTSSAAVGAPPPPPPPCDMPSWPCNHDGTASNPYIALAHHVLDHQEYLNSLIPPSSEEFIQIAGIQAIKEAQNKRRYRVQRRVAEEASRQKYRHDPFQSHHDVPAQTQPQEDTAYINTSHSRDSSILSISNYPSTSTSSRSRSSSLSNSQYTNPLPIIQQHTHNHGPNEPKPIDASTRWTQALREAQFRTLTTPRSRTGLTPELLQSLPSNFPLSTLPPTYLTPPTPRQRWKKALAIARRASFDYHAASSPDPLDDYQSDQDYLSSSSTSSSPFSSPSNKNAKKPNLQARLKEEAKTINDLYLLELVDSKHRYGLNLLVYHSEWKRSTDETNGENFFYWLDYGAGRQVDIPTCPRAKLNRQQIRYLSHEEQTLYLVVVGSGGRLCWAKNGIPVDTSDRWRDSVEGIVRAGDAAGVYRPRAVSSSCGSLMGNGGEMSLSNNSTAPSKELNKLKYGNSHASWLVDKLLRQQWGTTPWIFVADSSGRLYIGIKETGTFQHTSFVRGSRVAAAGMIAVKEGRLTGLSPLSGHYRPPTSNFRAFVKSLKEQGVDLEGARLLFGQDYLLLRGFEIYSGLRRAVGIGGEGKAVERKGEVVKSGSLLIDGGGFNTVDTLVKEDVMIKGIDYGSGDVGREHDGMELEVGHETKARSDTGSAQRSVLLQRLRKMTSGYGFGVEKEGKMNTTNKEKKEKKRRKRKRKSIFSVKVKI